jgi:hypothetical protein
MLSPQHAFDQFPLVRLYCALPPGLTGGAMIEDGAAMPVELALGVPEVGTQRRLGPTPSGRDPGGQGPIPAPPPPPPPLAAAAGPVVPVPVTVLPVPDVPGALELPTDVPVPDVPLDDVPVPVVEDVPLPDVPPPTTEALLPLRPEAPIPAPVVPPVWATAMQETPSSNAAEIGKILRAVMGGLPR